MPASFSQRSALGVVTPLSRAVATARERGAIVADLTLSNPPAAGLAPDSAALAEALADRRAARYAPSALGPQRAREAVATWLTTRGRPAPADRIALSASTSEAYAWIFKVLCDPGDDLLIPQPSYPLFDHLARFEGIRTIPYPLAYDGRWHIDLAALRAAIGPRTRAIVVVSPNNPTGSYLTQAERVALEALGLPLVVDEVFADYPLEAPADRATATAAPTALTFSLGGLSKACGMPQLKLAWTRLSGPADEVDEARARLELVADCFLSRSAPVLWGLPRLLALGDEVRTAIAARTATNLRALRDRVGPGCAATVLRVEGGWSAVVRVPRVLSEEAWATTLLLEDGVVVHPGYFYDFADEAYLVLSLLPRPRRFVTGIDRLLARVERATAEAGAG